MEWRSSGIVQYLVVLIIRRDYLQPADFRIQPSINKIKNSSKSFMQFTWGSLSNYNTYVLQIKSLNFMNIKYPYITRVYPPDHYMQNR